MGLNWDINVTGEQQLARLERTVGELTTRNENLTRSLGKQMLAAQDLAASHTTLSSAFSKVSADNTKLSASFAQINAQMAPLKAQIATLEAEVVGLAAANARLSTSNTAVAASHNVAGSAAKTSAANHAALNGAVRGAAGAMGKLWLAYGDIIPMLTAFAAAASVKSIQQLGAEFEYLTQYAYSLSDTSLALGSIRKELLAMKGVAQTPTALAGGFLELQKAGYGSKESMDSLGIMAKYASVSEQDLHESTKQLVTILNAYAGSSKDASGNALTLASTADIVAAAAQGSVVSFQEMQTALRYTTALSATAELGLLDVSAALMVMGDAGLGGSLGATALRTALERMLDPTDKFTGLLHKAGIQMNKFASGDSIMSLKEMFAELNRIKETVSKEEWIKISRAGFGFRGELVTAAITDLRKYDAALLKLRDSAGFVDKVFMDLSKTTKFVAKELSASFETALVKAFNGDKAVGVLNELKNIVGSESFSSAISGLTSGMYGIATAMAWMANRGGKDLAMIAGALVAAKAAQILFNTAVSANPYMIAFVALTGLNEILREVGLNVGVLIPKFADFWMAASGRIDPETKRDLTEVEILTRQIENARARLKEQQALDVYGTDSKAAVQQSADVEASIKSLIDRREQLIEHYRRFPTFAMVTADLFNVQEAYANFKNVLAEPLSSTPPDLAASIFGDTSKFFQTAQDIQEAAAKTKRSIQDFKDSLKGEAIKEYNDSELLVATAGFSDMERAVAKLNKTYEETKPQKLLQFKTAGNTEEDFNKLEVEMDKRHVKEVEKEKEKYAKKAQVVEDHHNKLKSLSEQLQTWLANSDNKSSANKLESLKKEYDAQVIMLNKHKGDEDLVRATRVMLDKKNIEEVAAVKEKAASEEESLMNTLYQQVESSGEASYDRRMVTIAAHYDKQEKLINEKISNEDKNAEAHRLNIAAMYKAEDEAAEKVAEKKEKRALQEKDFYRDIKKMQLEAGIGGLSEYAKEVEELGIKFDEMLDKMKKGRTTEEFEIMKAAAEEAKKKIIELGDKFVLLGNNPFAGFLIGVREAQKESLTLAKIGREMALELNSSFKEMSRDIAHGFSTIGDKVNTDQITSIKDAMDSLDKKRKDYAYEDLGFELERMKNDDGSGTSDKLTDARQEQALQQEISAKESKVDDLNNQIDALNNDKNKDKFKSQIDALKKEKNSISDEIADIKKRDKDQSSNDKISDLEKTQQKEEQIAAEEARVKVARMQFITREYQTQFSGAMKGNKDMLADYLDNLDTYLDRAKENLSQEEFAAVYEQTMKDLDSVNKKFSEDTVSFWDVIGNAWDSLMDRMKTKFVDLIADLVAQNIFSAIFGGSTGTGIGGAIGGTVTNGILGWVMDGIFGSGGNASWSNGTGSGMGNMYGDEVGSGSNINSDSGSSGGGGIAGAAGTTIAGAITKKYLMEYVGTPIYNELIAPIVSEATSFLAGEAAWSATGTYASEAGYFATEATTTGTTIVAEGTTTVAVEGGTTVAVEGGTVAATETGVAAGTEVGVGVGSGTMGVIGGIAMAAVSLLGMSELANQSPTRRSLGGDPKEEGSIGSIGLSDSLTNITREQIELAKSFGVEIKQYGAISLDAANGIMVATDALAGPEGFIAGTQFGLYTWDEGSKTWYKGAADNKNMWGELLTQMSEMGPVTSESITKTAKYVAEMNGVPSIADELAIAFDLLQEELGGLSGAAGQSAGSIAAAIAMMGNGGISNVSDSDGQVKSVFGSSNVSDSDGQVQSVYSDTGAYRGHESGMATGGVVDSLLVPKGDDGFQALSFGEGVIDRRTMEVLSKSIRSGEFSDKSSGSQVNLTIPISVGNESLTTLIVRVADGQAAVRQQKNIQGRMYPK